MAGQVNAEMQKDDTKVKNAEGASANLGVNEEKGDDAAGIENKENPQEVLVKKSKHRIYAQVNIFK